MLWKEMIYIGLFTLGVAYLVITYMPTKGFEILEKLLTAYSLIGFVISLLLVFRTNTAYDRWWEGRQRWGALVNDTRNLAIKISTMIANDEDRNYFERMIPNFVFAMKGHLRDNVIMDELDLIPTESEKLERSNHIPNAISQMIYERIQTIKRAVGISEEEYIVLDKNMNALLDSLGACERIHNTPIPFSYSLFLKKFIFIYVTTMPLAFVTSFGYYSAILATFVFYVLVSMEVLAEEIEDPFGMDDNDLPTDQLSDKIKTNVQEIFTKKQDTLETN